MVRRDVLDEGADLGVERVELAILVDGGVQRPLERADVQHFRIRDIDI